MCCLMMAKSSCSHWRSNDFLSLPCQQLDIAWVLCSVPAVMQDHKWQLVCSTTMQSAACTEVLTHCKNTHLAQDCWPQLILFVEGRVFICCSSSCQYPVNTMSWPEPCEALPVHSLGSIQQMLFVATLSFFKFSRGI